MGIVELFALGVGLSMDAFAVSVCKGLSVKRAGAFNMLKCGLWFGGFQALMPLIGYFLGRMFANAIKAVDHWIAFLLLVFIGINMIKETFEKCDNCQSEKNADFCFKTMLTMAIATSIDALAVGISLAMAGNVNIFAAIALIGIITCILSATGVKIGSTFGAKFEKKAQIFGGLILIALGLKILLEHLGVF